MSLFIQILDFWNSVEFCDMGTDFVETEGFIFLAGAVRNVLYKIFIYLSSKHSPVPKPICCSKNSSNFFSTMRCFDIIYICTSRAQFSFNEFGNILMASDIRNLRT